MGAGSLENPKGLGVLHRLLIPALAKQRKQNRESQFSLESRDSVLKTGWGSGETGGREEGRKP